MLEYLNNSSLESNDDPAPIIKTSFIAIDNSLHFLRTIFDQTITLREQYISSLKGRAFLTTLPHPNIVIVLLITKLEKIQLTQ